MYWFPFDRDWLQKGFDDGYDLVFFDHVAEKRCIYVAHNMGEAERFFRLNPGVLTFAEAHLAAKGHSFTVDYEAVRFMFVCLPEELDYRASPLGRVGERIKADGMAAILRKDRVWKEACGSALRILADIRSLGANPNNDRTHASLGWALANKGDLDGAVAEYREALRLNPDNGNAHYLLGLALGKKGDWDGAMAECREALRLDPNNAIAHHALGMVLEREGNFEGALREYRVAHNLDPQNPEYRKRCERLSWALPPENTLPF